MAAGKETWPAPKDERLYLEPRIKLWVEKDGRLVRSEMGGVGGGGSRLTPEGERLLALYQRFRRAMESDLGREFQEAFKG